MTKQVHIDVSLIDVCMNGVDVVYSIKTYKRIFILIFLNEDKPNASETKPKTKSKQKTKLSRLLKFSFRSTQDSNLKPPDP